MGLDTTHDARQIGPAWATVANNVMLSDGRVRPRPGFRELVPDGNVGGPSESFNVVGVFSWVRGVALEPTLDRANSPVVVAVGYRWSASEKLTDVRLVAWNRGTNDPEVERVELASQVVFSDKRLAATPQFILVRGVLYVFAGPVRWVVAPNRLSSLGPESVYTLSMPKPTMRRLNGAGDPGNVMVVVSSIDTAPGGNGIGAQVQYAFTLERIVQQEGDNVGVVTESNPKFSSVLTIAGSDGVQFTFPPPPPPPFVYPTAWGDATINVYRKNKSIGSTGYRLIHKQGLTDGINFFDSLAEDEITVSSQVTGPFAPALNDEPPAGGTSAYFQGRMWYTDPVWPGRVYWSNFDRPGEVGADSWFDLAEGFSDRIHSMAVLAGQLVIGSEDGIDILTGTFSSPTNLTVALGAPAPPATHTLYRTRAHLGPVGEHSFILFGSPAMLYFPHWTGFYAFDGQNAGMVSDLIKPTWQRFVRSGGNRDENLHLTYGHDPLGQVIWMTNRPNDIGHLESEPAPMLLYHYGVNRGDGRGIWATATLAGWEAGAWTAPGCLGGYGFDEEVEGFNEADANPAHALYSPVLIGSLAGGVSALRFGNEIQPLGEAPRVPEFHYRSGKMPIREGFNHHVYHLDYFYADAPVGLGFSGAPAKFGYVDGSGTVDFIHQNMTNPGTAKQRVGESLRTLQIVFEKADEWFTGWHPGLGLIGWAADIERIGQR